MRRSCTEEPADWRAPPYTFLAIARRKWAAGTEGRTVFGTGDAEWREQALRQSRRGQRAVARRAGPRVPRAARPFRVRQDDRTAAHRRAGGPLRRRDPHRRPLGAGPLSER